MLWRKLSFIHCRFITEAWSESIQQWIGTKEEQFGKIGRDRERADMSFYFIKLSDIIIMNSCLWDVNRRGPTFKEIYEENLNKLVENMNNKFPNTQFYWMTTPPSNFDFNKGRHHSRKTFF